MLISNCLFPHTSKIRMDFQFDVYLPAGQAGLQS